MTALTLEQIAQRVQTLVNAETVAISLAEAQGQTVYHVAAVGKHAEVIVGKRGDAATSGLCGAVFQAGNSVLVCQAQGDPRVRQDYVEALGINSALGIPLHHQGRLLGSFMILNRQDGQTFDREDEQRLNEYAQAIAPQLQQLLEQQ